MTGRAQSSSTPSGQDDGFTLIEVLVALALLSLLSLVLLASLRFAVAAWQRSSLYSEWADRTLVLQNQLRRFIGDAYPRYLTDDAGRGHVAFTGTASSLSFLAPTPVALGGTAHTRFALFVDERDGRADLVLTSTPELVQGDASALSSKRLLLNDIRGLEIGYFGKVRSARQAAWHDAWSEQPTLPRLIRIRLHFEIGRAHV